MFLCIGIDSFDEDDGYTLLMRAGIYLSIYLSNIYPFV
jgi:hypothetical protein